MTLGSRQTRRKRRARRRGKELKKDAHAALFLVVARVYMAARGVAWPVLFYALLFCLVGSVVCVLTGGTVLAVLLFLASLLLMLGLWTRELE